MAINKVGSKGIVDCSVAAADFAPGTITSAKIADDAVTNAKLSNSSLTASGTSVALGASITLNNAFIDWQSKVTSDGSTVTTMVAGRGYFIDNSSAAGIVKLPASASIGDKIVIKDYAGNFATNKLTIQRNGHNIQGVANNSEIGTNRASVVLVYVDSTKGWLYTDEHNVDDLQFTQFTAATGGTVSQSGNFKIHTFTGDGNFVVSQVGTGQGPAVVDYLVVAGGGGGNGGSQGAGGAGGFRLSNSTCMPAPLTSPLANPTGITVTAQTYPISVGGGGAGGPVGAGAKGSDSVFSTITSTGGGFGESGTGGSGGGGGATGSGAAGNTPPVSPPQGNNGGNGSPTQSVPTGGSSGGGGGAGAVGGNGSTSAGGNGGAGSYVLQTGFAGCNGTPGPVGSTRYFSGGGGGGTYLSATGGSGANGGGNGGNSNQPTATAGTAASANTGSGGGGGGHSGSAYTAGAAGGKGIVILRYKFQ